MDVSASSSGSTALQQAITQNQPQTSVLKAANELPAEAIQGLLSSLPETTSSNPLNLGQNIDVSA